MTHKSIKISINGFLYLLNRFKTKCYSGKCDYKKIPYNTWRELNRYTRGNVRIYLYPTGIIQLVILDDCDNLPITTYGFDMSDNSFGSFLFEEMNWDELDDDITRFDKEYEYKNWYDNSNTSVSNLLTYDLDTSTSIDNTGLATDTTATTSSSCDWYYTTNLSNKADKSDLDALEKKVQDVIDKYENNNNNNNNNDNEENKNMKNFNFDFGPMNGNVVRMSMYGLAVRDKTGAYVSYDAKAGEIMNVDILNFDGANFLYKMPVAIKDIAVGDVVIHQNVPMFVVAMSAPNKTLTVVDPVLGERKEIMLARSPFGFNFATKVVNFLGNAFDTAASAENPFGNMWMLLAMNEDADMSSILPMMMFAQGGAADPSMAMVMMAMSQKNGKMDMASMLPMMWMMNNNKPAATCHCGCHKDGE